MKTVANRVGWSGLCGVVAAFLSVFACCAEGGAQDAKPPNVLFIGVDTLRADHLGCYGYDKSTSPNIDVLAGQGVRYTRALAQRGLTLPSLASIMTSLYPVAHGVRINAHQLSTVHVTLSRVLRDHQYACHAFSANELTWKQQWDGFEGIEPCNEEEVTEGGIEWMRSHKDAPFFLWLFYYAPHKPFLPPVEYGRRFLPGYDGTLTERQLDDEIEGITLNRTPLTPEQLGRYIALYDAEIAYSDHQVGRVLAALDELGLADNTLVVFFADHGEEMYDHHCYFYHIASIHGSALHVPVIFRLPGGAHQGTRHDEIIQLIDIAPTVLDFLGLPKPPAFQGRSLWPVSEKPAEGLGYYAVSENKSNLLSIRTPEYCYIWNPLDEKTRWLNPEFLRGRTGDMFIKYQKQELYNLAQDPLEQTNIAAERPEAVQEMDKRLSEWRQRFGWELGAESAATVVQELHDTARTLGYVN